MVERGEPIRASDAQFILEDGFGAMTQWVAAALRQRVEIRFVPMQRSA